MRKNTGRRSFAEVAISHRKTVNVFLEQVNELIDWERVADIIDNYDRRGKGIAGNRAYPGLVLFRMCLLGIWYQLSDRALEDRVNDSISFNRFCGLSLADPVPDHSIVSRFRTMMTEGGGWDGLLREINRQLEGQGLLVRTGTLVDASITESPRKPSGKPTYEVYETGEGDSEMEDSLQCSRVYGPGVDQEATWTKKAGKSYFGYKKHHATDMEGMVLAVETTPANTHDSQVFTTVVERSNPRKATRCYADKGYVGQDRDDWLVEKKLKNGIHYKAYRNRPLTERQKQVNHLISKVRWAVERTFGGQVRWFGAGKARYIGLAATHTQHVLEAICYNLKRAPGRYLEKQKREALMG